MDDQTKLLLFFVLWLGFNFWLVIHIVEEGDKEIKTELAIIIEMIKEDRRNAKSKLLHRGDS